MYAYHDCTLCFTLSPFSRCSAITVYKCDIEPSLILQQERFHKEAWDDFDNKKSISATKMASVQQS